MLKAVTNARARMMDKLVAQNNDIKSYSMKFAELEQQARAEAENTQGTTDLLAKCEAFINERVEKSNEDTTLYDNIAIDNMDVGNGLDVTVE
jgi:hypothetical protein